MNLSRHDRIALIGKSGAGKSTAATMIAERLNMRKLSTGFLCRSIAKSLFGNEDKASTQKIDNALTQIDSSIFLKATLRDVNDGEAICLDSLRFGSDYSIARAMRFTIIRVTAPAPVRNARLKARGQIFDPELDGRHRSETELENVDVDFTICNDGTLGSMRDIINKLFARAK